MPPNGLKLTQVSSERVIGNQQVDDPHHEKKAAQTRLRRFIEARQLHLRLQQSRIRFCPAGFGRPAD